MITSLIERFGCLYYLKISPGNQRTKSYVWYNNYTQRIKKSIIYTEEQKMSNSEDLRVIKTKRNIEAAFLALLKEHSFDKITVQMLLTQAMISKGTFYAHYLDKYDLAEKITAAALQEFQTGIRERMTASLTGADRKSIGDSLRNTLTSTIPLLNLLKKIHTDKIDVAHDMHQIITQEYLALQEKQGIKLEQPNFRAHIITTFILGFLEWQEAHPFEHTLEEYMTELKQVLATYELLTNNQSS